MYASHTRRVVVPAAVACVLNPSNIFAAKRFAFASRAARVEAVAALATPVPVGRPVNTGVSSVGVLSTTNFVPVPVCEAIDVAFQTDVIGQVRLAFVVTVAALPEILVWSPVFVPE